MKKWIALCLCVMMLVGMTACNNNLVNPYDESDESLPTQYVQDEALNRFIVDFNQQGRYKMAGMVQEADGSVSAEIDVCTVHLISTKYGVHISLMGGDTIASRDRMLDIFSTITKAADSSCSESQLAVVVDKYKKQTESSSPELRVSNYMKVLTFVPVINEGTVKVDCRMELLAMKYLPATE